MRSLVPEAEIEAPRGFFAELVHFCAGLPHEGGAAIRCLQNEQDQAAFGEACRIEVATHEARISTDYRCDHQACPHRLLQHSAFRLSTHNCLLSAAAQLLAHLECAMGEGRVLILRHPTELQKIAPLIIS